MEVVFEDDFVKVGFSSKFGGVSTGKFDSLNLSLNVGDKADNVLQNREILRKFLKAKELVFMEQIHSDKISQITKFGQTIKLCDALISDLRGIGLCAMAADCNAILLYDRKRLQISAIHAGRAGVMSQILTKTIKKMGSDPRDLMIFVSPSINGECYQVGELDLGEFNAYKKDGKFMIKQALFDEIKALKIEQIYISQICTHCDDRFFSYRRDGVTGRFCGFVVLKENFNV